MADVSKQDLVGFTPDPRNPREPFEFGRRRRNSLEPPFVSSAAT